MTEKESDNKQLNALDRDVEKFAEAMTLVLSEHADEKGDSWKRCDIAFLQAKLQEEVKEYQDASGSFRKAQELVDIANFCMMLYHRHVDEWVSEAADNLPDNFLDGLY